MKNYKKKETVKSKLLQIRLSEKEHKEISEFINRFGVTHREWILTVVNHLEDKTVIRENSFWESNTSFAYFNNDRYDKKLNEDSECEECGKKNFKDYRGHWQLDRHHYLGYEGENAFKVQILCKSCHSKKPKNYGKKI